MDQFVNNFDHLVRQNDPDVAGLRSDADQPQAKRDQPEGSRGAWLGVWLGVMAGCAHPQAAPSAGPAERVRYVDARAAEGGDGSRARPFRSLAEALAEAGRGERLTVELASGVYEGPFELAGEVRLVGRGAVVLHAEGPFAVSAAGRVSLERLTVQGGTVGLQVFGELSLSGVQLSGQREVSVLVRGGALEARGCEFSATVSETTGLRVEEGARAQVERSAFLGPYRRAVELRSGEVRLSGARFAGPVTGLHQLGGRAEVERSTFSGGRGPALFSAGGALSGRQVLVHGHEYGLQTGEGATVDVRDLAVHRPDRAGIALVGTRGTLTDVVVVGGGSLGGAQALGSDLVVERLRVHAVSGFALLARHGKLTLSDAVLTDIRAEKEGSGEESGGDGLMLRGVEARIEDVTARELGGSGLVASAEATVAVRGLTCHGCRFGAILVERGARVDAVSVEARGGDAAAVSVPDAGRLRIHLLRSSGNALGPVWTECGAGAEVLLGQVESDVPVRTAPCIGRWREPRLGYSSAPSKLEK